MEVAGVTLALVATTDLCFKYGKILVKTCEAFKGAEAEINERVLCIENHWKRTTMQLEVIRQIWGSLDEEHQSIQNRTLQVLASKLSMTISKLEKCLRKNPGDRTTEHQSITVKRTKYVQTKTSLDEAIQDLADWQRMFDPSWFLMLKLSEPLIDQQLKANVPTTSSLISAHRVRDALKQEPLQKSTVFLPKDDLDTARIRDIAFTSARVLQRVNSNKLDIVDCIPCDPEADITQMTKDIRELARKLSSVDPLTFGILQCRGVVRMTDSNTPRPSAFNFISRIPDQFSENKPKSLRDYLHSQLNLTLTARFGLAKQLAKSISYVHTLGFVHKNIRPETVLGFHQTTHGSSSANDAFFLVGFENVRLADGRTMRAGDSSWDKNLYRHPHRQGLHPQDIYTMQHDIYSLGVCLLEIGLWLSFLIYNDDSPTTIPDQKKPQPAGISDTDYARSQQTLPAAELDDHVAGTAIKRPVQMKEHLVAFAQRDLPLRMGERYASVVVNCLTCLDEDNVDFGDQSEFEDRDGILVGVKYIEKILLKLDEILV
ncbi:MAG: hypothetical protein Q9169_005995 [Polycauliona sp. 2 TL-2023]